MPGASLAYSLSRLCLQITVDAVGLLRLWKQCGNVLTTYGSSVAPVSGCVCPGEFSSSDAEAGGEEDTPLSEAEMGSESNCGAEPSFSFQDLRWMSPSRAAWKGSPGGLWVPRGPAESAVPAAPAGLAPPATAPRRWKSEGVSPHLGTTQRWGRARSCVCPTVGTRRTPHQGRPFLFWCLPPHLQR